MTMGTKATPSPYDCFQNLEPDEPYFLLMGRDPAAANLVRLWAVRRQEAIDAGEKPADDEAQVKEALLCAEHMEVWRLHKNQPPPEEESDKPVEP
jgi:hypothetical protein